MTLFEVVVVVVFTVHVHLMDTGLGLESPSRPICFIFEALTTYVVKNYAKLVRKQLRM